MNESAIMPPAGEITDHWQININVTYILRADLLFRLATFKVMWDQKAWKLKAEWLFNLLDSFKLNML